MDKFRKILILIDPDETIDLTGLGVYDLRLLKVDKGTVIPLATLIIGGLQNISHNVIIIVDARNFLLQNIDMVESFEITGDLPQAKKPDFLELNKLIIQNQLILQQINSLTKVQRKKEQNGMDFKTNQKV